mgnify:CR=1 FL=1
MRFLKIMGIFTSILSLLSCGHGNKRVTQNDGINSNIPVAAPDYDRQTAGCIEKRAGRKY